MKIILFFFCFFSSLCADLRTDDLKQKVCEILPTLDGWCSQDKALILIDLILQNKPETIVEIGVYGGKSLIPMACALKENEKGKVYGIDAWSPMIATQGMLNKANKTFWSGVNYNELKQNLDEKIQELQLENYVQLIRRSSSQAPPIENIDILHLDGNLSAIPSFQDVKKWVPLVKEGGWIIFTGIHWAENGIFTTTQAVDWLNATCIKQAEFSEQCGWAVWRKP